MPVGVLAKEGGVGLSAGATYVQVLRTAHAQGSTFPDKQSLVEAGADGGTQQR